MSPPSTAHQSIVTETPLHLQGTVELVDRARRCYLRALTSSRHSFPAELASTLALVPVLCRQLEILEESAPGAGAAPPAPDGERDRVLRVVAHELRNRLNSPRLHARLLEDALGKHAEDEEPRRLSELLGSGIESAASVVEDIASLLSPAPSHQGPLSTLIRDLAQQHAARAEELGVSLEVIEPLSSASFSRCGMRLVLENLILNALEHHDGSPAPWVRVSAEDGDDEVAVRVEDNGPGLPQEVQDRLRAKSVTDHPRSRDAGLGLVVVRRAAESLGARLELVTGSERGTCLVLRLQAERP
ncbi:MAG TPA: HAMP domain-containing sensor histidine kinase [Thermoanaerobaculia bacterium]|nr:HAMP domain-containing sensor histidine kinase [Thermoanaerobaculia bacterium]